MQNDALLNGLKKVRDYSEDEKTKRKSQLIMHCLNLARMVKPFGYIQFNKFLSEYPCTIFGKKFNIFSDALTYYLGEIGFIPEIINSKYSGIMIIAQKGT